MGLALRKTLENGVTLEYWRVVSLTTIVNEKCMIEVAGYTSKEKRDEVQAALAEARKTGEYMPVDAYIDTDYISVEYDPDMSVSKAYAMLKASEDFDGAEDVVENWLPGAAYYVEDTVIYEGKTYRCVQSHTSQDGWSPDATPAMWAEVAMQGEVIEWRQPVGAADAYMAGDHVTHNGKEWTSTVDNNVWEPGVYGWEEVAGGESE